ncbi:transcriptional regulator [Salmonella enterica subsp. enterica serovar Telelkebir]|nr:transcriptional regulator [Salmonella enterica subsp. enterica serovar Telelkebir]ECU9605501.1 transcriptional regulator [Salmonella enterica subsp. enterica serovar Telelkebir]
MSKTDYLLRLRHISNIRPLEKVMEKKQYDDMSSDERSAFNAAADHLLAELITGRIFDRAPPVSMDLREVISD